MALVASPPQPGHVPACNRLGIIIVFEHSSKQQARRTPQPSGAARRRQLRCRLPPHPALASPASPAVSLEECSSAYSQQAVSSPSQTAVYKARVHALRHLHRPPIPLYQLSSTSIDLNSIVRGSTRTDNAAALLSKGILQRAAKRPLIVLRPTPPALPTDEHCDLLYDPVWSVPRLVQAGPAGARWHQTSTAVQPPCSQLKRTHLQGGRVGHLWRARPMPLHQALWLAAAALVPRPRPLRPTLSCPPQPAHRPWTRLLADCLGLAATLPLSLWLHARHIHPGIPFTLSAPCPRPTTRAHRELNPPPPPPPPSTIALGPPFPPPPHISALPRLAPLQALVDCYELIKDYIPADLLVDQNGQSITIQ